MLAGAWLGFVERRWEKREVRDIGGALQVGWREARVVREGRWWLLERHGHDAEVKRLGDMPAVAMKERHHQE